MLKNRYHNCIASTYKDTIIAHDRDQLLQTYPALQDYLRSEGYELHFCPSLLDLRVIYELSVRNKEGRHLLVLNQLDLPLPDILKNTHYAEVGLGDLFPKLDTEVLKGLGYRELDKIFEMPNFDTKSRSETIKFILERIYNIDYDSLIKSDAIEQWLAAILNLYDHNTALNEALLGFFKKAVKPLDEEVSVLIGSKQELLNYLQKQWKLYVQEGVSKVNFSNNLLMKELNQLFIRGELEPVEVTQAKEADFKYSIGVYVDKKASLKKSFISLKEEINKKINNNLESVYDWLNFFPLIARLKYFALKISEDEINEQARAFEKKINERFQDFVEKHFNSLFTLSGRKHPATVTRILDYLSGVRCEKKAIIVIDGLNLWQWELLREETGIKQGTLRVSLAWIPTITAWSRQAIFKGGKPDLSSNNQNEDKLFERYWVNNGVQKHQIAYQRFGSNKEILNTIDYSKKILGLVTNDIDELMHGTKMGNEQFFNSTELWAENGMLGKLIAKLKTENFKVWITSDHGNIEAVGNGNLPRKTSKFVQSKGKRHIHFDNDDLKKAFLDQGKSEYNFAEINNSLYLKDETAFALEGEKLVTHGGSHFWEVAVPFIEI